MSRGKTPRSGPAAAVKKNDRLIHLQRPGPLCVWMPCDGCAGTGACCAGQCGMYAAGTAFTCMWCAGDRGSWRPILPGMKSWSWLRLGTLAAGVAAGAVSVFVPVLAPFTGPAAAFLIGVAVKTPGHEPTPPPNPPIIR